MLLVGALATLPGVWPRLRDQALLKQLRTELLASLGRMRHQHVRYSAEALARLGVQDQALTERLGVNPNPGTHYSSTKTRD